jgi:hypothetical protein
MLTPALEITHDGLATASCATIEPSVRAGQVPAARLDQGPVGSGWLRWRRRPTKVRTVQNRQSKGPCMIETATDAQPRPAVASFVIGRSVIGARCRLRAGCNVHHRKANQWCSWLARDRLTSAMFQAFSRLKQPDGQDGI